MRILHIGNAPAEVGGRTTGGVPTHIWDLATHLARRGCEVGLVAHNFACAGNTPTWRDGITVYGLSKRRTLLSPDFLKPNFWSRAIATKRHLHALASWQGIVWRLTNHLFAIRDFCPDVIHAHNPELYFPYAYWANECSVPIVTTVHSTHAIEFRRDPHREPVKRLIGRSLALMQNIIFVSQYVQERYERIYETSLDMRVRVIYNPLDTSLFYPIDRAEARQYIGEDAETRLIVATGNLIPRKGFDLLVDATARLDNKDNLRVRIVGDGPEEENLARRIRSLDLQQVITLAGRKTRQDLLYYYNAADVFVLPSRMESFGLVYFEAMLCGCPIVGTPEVLAELLPGEDCGLRTPVDDVLALTQAITRALEKPWNHDRIREYAQQFDWNKRVDQYINLYDEIIREHSAVQNPPLP